MPELPEAETIARELHRRLVGATLGRVTVLRADVIHGDPRPLSRMLPGKRVIRVGRRAKRVIVTLDPATELTFHLGMSGRLTVTPKDDPVEKHTHLRIEFPGLDAELRFRDPRRFGGVWCHVDDAGRQVKPKGRTLGEVGIEPLDAKPAAFLRLLQRRRQIKALLLDQRVIAGIGNIYCDESLYAASIHPLTRADGLGDDRGRALLRSIKATLNRAIRFNGSTLMDYRRADGTEGSFQKHHRVYQREGKPCRRCGTPIQRILAAGRSTFFCPACQARDTST